MAEPTFDAFMARYDPDGKRVIADIDVQRNEDGDSPFIIVRYAGFSAVIVPMPFDGKGGHLCIDVHPFVGGKDATAGVFGMSNGVQWRLPDTGTTSHGWPSANGISVLIGAQAKDPEPELTRVMFRVWSALPRTVIALFPDLPGDTHDIGKCESFEHVGQHGAASLVDVIERTRPAEPGEYAELRRELERAPYNYVLDPVRRTPTDSADLRRAALRRGRQESR